MKIERRDGKTETRIVTAMCVSDSVLGRIVLRWENDLFASKWAQIVGGWCVKYYRRHQKAPNKSIQSIFESWAEKHKDKDTIELVERFLVHLSNEHDAEAKEINPDHIIDLAEEYLNIVKVRRFKEALEGDLEAGTLKEALERIEKFGKIEMSAASGIDLFQSPEIIRQAIERVNEPIVEYPGAYGEFINPVLERDAFVCFYGQSKIGKSIYLADLALLAAKQRNRVAYFQLGDLSQDQAARRLAMRVAGVSLKPCTIRIPTDMGFSGNRVTVEFVERFCEGMDWRTVWDSFTRMQTKFMKSKGSYFKMSIHPASSISIRGVEAMLDQWERQDWVCDVLVLDYIDLLAPVDRQNKSVREQLIETWRLTRSLSSKKHCLLVTATQTNADSFGASMLGKNNFSENSKSFAEVTAAIGINQEREEKEVGVQRLNWLDARDHYDSRVVYLAGCRAIGNPAVLSAFKPV